MPDDPRGWFDRWRAEAETLQWDRPFDAVATGEGADRRWFPGGLLNAAVNCVDRHGTTRADQPAILWEGEPGDPRTLPYPELQAERAAAAPRLPGLGSEA